MSGPTTFRPVHPTHARLAGEDHETWEPVVVVRVDPPVITVSDSAGTTRVYRSGDAGVVGHAANAGVTLAHLTERWDLLAIESEHGQIIRNPNADHSHPGSIWNLSGADRLRFVRIDPADDGPGG